MTVLWYARAAMRSRLLVLALPALVVAVVAACTGDDPEVDPIVRGKLGGPCYETNECDAGLECVRDQCAPREAGAGDAGGGDAGTDATVPGDAGDAGDAADGQACGARDMNPCGCASGQDCCFSRGDGGTTCEPGGNAQCAVIDQIACVTSSQCAAGGTCCFKGTFARTGECSSASLKDIQCNAGPCGPGETVACLTDDDCDSFNAGVCVSVELDVIGRTIGLCVK